MKQATDGTMYTILVLKSCHRTKCINDTAALQTKFAEAFQRIREIRTQLEHSQIEIPEEFASFIEVCTHAFHRKKDENVLNTPRIIESSAVDWLIDQSFDKLIDWSIGLLIDWLINRTLDRLIDWMTYWSLIFSRYFEAFERRKPLSMDPAEVPIDMPATTEDMFSLCDLILDFVRDALAKNSIDLQLAEEKLLKHSSHEPEELTEGQVEKMESPNVTALAAPAVDETFRPSQWSELSAPCVTPHSVQWTWLTAIKQLWGSRRYSRNVGRIREVLINQPTNQSINQSMQFSLCFWFVLDF